MSEYIIQRETLTAIADEVRTLSGTTDEMSLDTLTTHVNDANIEITNQEDLLEQIASALEGKAGTTGAQIDTCTVNLDVFIKNRNDFYVSYSAYELGKVVGKYQYSETSLITLENVICGSLICIYNGYSYNEVSVSQGASFLFLDNRGIVTCTAPMEANSTGSITVYDID